MEEIKDTLSIKNIAKRTKSKTPKFFKDLQKACGVISTIGTGLLAVPGISPIVGVVVIVAGAVGAGVAQLTKE